MENPGISAGGGTEEKPRAGAEGVTWSEKGVAKHTEKPPRKAAMAFHAPVP